MPKLPMFTAPQTKASDDFVWFVYGSSLDVDALKSWCAEHGYVAPDLATAKPAVLGGWRLAFNVRSNFWGGVVASLVEDPAGRVEGLAFRMPAPSMGFVRHKEGVVSGLFEERDARCSIGGEETPCKVFVAAPARTVPEGAPAPRFLDTLIKGAKERGLSAEWVAALEKMRA
ncbi:MAG TPA: gamma-glutamylcyclotransferase [bacterium]|nr:gamma-glutamylcyclotransferase [bacterium]